MTATYNDIIMSTMLPAFETHSHKMTFTMLLANENSQSKKFFMLLLFFLYDFL